MMMDVAGGTPSKARIAGRPPIKKKVIPFNLKRVEKLAGLSLSEAQARRTLEALGFALAGKGETLDVTVPTWRPDVHGPADLVEEVARIYGLDAIPSAAMPRAYGVARPVLTEKQRRVRRARRLLAGRGLVETVTWSFITHTQAELFGGGQKALELANPISSEMSDMRPSLLPSLLEAAQKNRNHGHADLSLFELGQVYRGDRPEDQFMIAGGVRTGTVSLAGAGRLWDGSAREADFFEVKADVFALLSALGVDPARAQIVRDAPLWFHPGRSASLKLGPKVVLAHFGEVHPRTLSALDVAGPVAAFEVFFDALPTEKRKARTRPVFDAANLLPVTRDFAFVVGKDISAGDVVKAALAADKALIAGVSVFDVFEGGSLGAGRKSLAIAVTLAPKDKTLTDPEIEAISAKIVAEVQRATGGQIRS
jgi:phenylalanyl-tRNA synthetase beta chain